MQTSQIFKLPSELNFHKMPKFSNNVKNVVLLHIGQNRKASKMHCFEEDCEVGGEKVVNSFPSIGG